MKARKLDLRPYDLDYMGPNPETGKPFVYRVKESLADLCFVIELQLTGRELLTAHRVAQSILDAGDDILLAELDYSHLASACTVHKGFSRPDTELVRRVLEAPEVDVAEAAASGPLPG